ncbi:MAG: hypothetical protein Q8K75_00760 [Chlamydiales bacterium]|nr:hypothetical protein [Chlamydiales bacterium]
MLEIYNSQNSFANNNNSHNFFVANQCLILSPGIDTSLFWYELNHSLRFDPSWKHLKIDNIEIEREKILLIEQLRLPIAVARLPEIAKMDDCDLKRLGERSVTPIVRAIYVGDCDIVEQMLCSESKAAVTSIYTSPDSIQGLSLLDIAIFRGQDKLVTLLLRHGAADAGLNLNVPTSLLTSRPQIIAQLVPYGLVEMLTFRDPDKLSPLHHAAAAGDLTTLNLWMEAGATTYHRRGPYLQTPLDLALQCNHLDVALSLMGTGQLDKNCGILALAILQGEDIEFLRHLLERGASITAPHVGITPLKHAIDNNNELLIQLIVEFIPDGGRCIQELIEAWVQGCFRGRSAAAIAKTIHLLIEKLNPSTINGCTFQGIPLFHHAILCCDEALCLRLLEKGADPDTKSDSGISVLSLALIRNYQELAMALMLKGADIAALDYSGNSPVWLSLNHNNTTNIAQAMLALCNTPLPPKALYERYKELNIDWLKPSITQMCNALPDLHEEWKEQNLATICAHLFELKGEATLPSAKCYGPPLIFSREGMNGVHKFLGKVGNFTKKLAGIWSDDLKACVSSACYFSANDIIRSDEDYLTRIKAGEPTIIVSHSFMHSWNAMFYGDYFVVGNLNGTVEVFRYDKSYLTEDMIGAIRRFTAFTPGEEVESIIAGIKQRLKATQDEKCKELCKSAMWSKQTIGNCTWKSIECIIGTLLLIRGEQPALLPNWNQSMQVYFADRYISRHEKGHGLPYFPDKHLLDEMVHKLRATHTTQNSDEVARRGRALSNRFLPIPPKAYRDPMASNPINVAIYGMNLPAMLHYPRRAPRITIPKGKCA